ncbi:ATPase [Massilia sp. WF1]|uniref:BadF/BadG/BcrA/BcrD ATPase family protein n=1 Tax=unclassified Massilia TaxID=2609279 RepID=UPI00064AD305|nr:MULTISPECIES: BadF/BadG/BcrA/BcrD ATPase family protein [unclassified Massilia]ALK96194.1 ATPase [Massilia sp. WG5]KLU36167.1 ATPase [Massilia sp. WF1]
MTDSLIDYFIGVDGGGSGTRVRLARADGVQIAQGAGGPSGLGLGIARAWDAVQQAVAAAFAACGAPQAPLGRMAIGLGLAGVHNKQWAAEFTAANPGYAALRLETDGFTTLMGAHGGAPGAIVAIGTGSVGEVLRADGSRREVGGWGFPAGDEASGGWIGLRAVKHIEQVLDGRRERSAFADTIIEACGGHRDASRDAIQAWLGRATQTAYASLAPLVLQHGSTEADDPVARAILLDAGDEVAGIARALDPDGALPLALCGGLGAALRDFLPAGLLARITPPQGDSAAGALQMIALHTARNHSQ